MKKIMLAALITLVAFAFQSCRKINGVGPVVSKTYSTGTFTSLDVNLEADIFYTQDSNYSVEIHAQQNVLDIIETPISNGQLNLQFQKFKNIWKHDRITVYISAPSLNGLGVNGSGKIMVNQPMHSSSLALKINGSGSINVSSYTGETLSAQVTGSGNITVSGGTVNSEALRISGSGDLDLLGLSSKFVTADISGSGSATVRVSDNLDVHISGSGNVYYTGDPSVHTEISGSGKVRKM